MKLEILMFFQWPSGRQSCTMQDRKFRGALGMKIAKTAVLILAMAHLAAVAQRPDGRLDRKPSPATSAASVPMAQSGVPANSAPQRPNTSPNVVRRQIQPVPVQPVMRPAANAPANPVASPVAQPLVATPVQATIARPVASAVPASEPTVSVHYAQGLLTVTSQSASLGAVLKLISAKTGAVIDVAPELQNEPVVAQIGPSGVRDVMTALLDSPKIDYIIIGSGADSGGLQRILVRTRQSFGRMEFAANRSFQPPPPQEETELKLNQNVPPVAGVAKPQPLTQEQLMANWQKAREEKRLAEIEQQRQDRENEANGVEPPPQPEPQPNNNADNPPLN
jgi:hypothetical protein